ncbi:DUF2398 family protein [Streptomyces sp. NPDC001941]|uniref:DUF2398 family protein n=1 Tax=Streptomyces sp. NPDC001941 TaxID=3154659 RepID=UPI0033336160
MSAWNASHYAELVEGDDQETVSALVRQLRVRTWLIGGQDDELIGTVHRHARAVRAALAAVGCTLTLEADLVRVSVPPEPFERMPRGAAAEGVWYWLIVAALEGTPPTTQLGPLLAAVRCAAAEVEIPVTQSRAELSALVAALKMLCARGVLQEIHGSVEELLCDGEDPPVLLKVHHARLLHLLPRNVPLDEEGQWACDPATDPEGWLRTLIRSGDEGVRVCGMLADQAVVHICDLDEAEQFWFRSQLGREGPRVAELFGLHLEHRLEGASLVVPDEICSPRTLGPFRFPHWQGGSSGTVRHATLLLVDYLADHGERGGPMAPGEGWYGAAASGVVRHLGDLAVRHARWRQHFRQRPDLLAAQVREVLQEADLLRVVEGYEDWWWLSPAVARWTVFAADEELAGTGMEMG